MDPKMKQMQADYIELVERIREIGEAVFPAKGDSNPHAILDNLYNKCIVKKRETRTPSNSTNKGD